MKNCPGCSKEIDKYAIACQYCGKLVELKNQEASKRKTSKSSPPRKLKSNRPS